METGEERTIMQICALARLAKIDPKKLAKETHNFKANTEFLAEVAEETLKLAIKEGVIKGEDAKKLSGMFNSIQNGLNKSKYRDNDDGFKR